MGRATASTTCGRGTIRRGGRARDFTSNRYPSGHRDGLQRAAARWSWGRPVAGSGDDLTPEQKAQLLARAASRRISRARAGAHAAAQLTETRELVTGARHAERRGAHRLRLRKDMAQRRTPRRLVQRVGVGAPQRRSWRSAAGLTSAYARFVPTPGATLTFTASVRSGTARFRFELDPDATSRFPGYATNADVDDGFS